MTPDLSRVRAAASVARVAWWKAQNPSEPMTTSDALDLEADPQPVDTSLAGMIRDGAAYLRKRHGHKAVFAWLVEIEQLADKHRGVPGIARAAHAVKLQLMDGTLG